MSPLGWVHTTFALAALGSGAAVLLRPKGTRRHRQTGWLYVGSMVGLNGTALLIYRLFGGFGPFHVAALLSLATLAGGVLAAVRRRPGWVERHYWWMAYSYLGLLAATASEAATRLPGTVFWWAVLLASAVVFAGGAVLIAVRARPTLAPFRGPAGEQRGSEARPPSLCVR
jgi:uncharacterized membrane protein